ncbi:MAG: Ig-like domain-containing protein [Clostridia bacterium]|nr:Ig-like domain-containing protein [Clostridia bacterium]
MMFRKRLAIALSVVLLCMLAAVPALAADVFKFAASPIRVYAGETVTVELLRDGRFAEGDVEYSVKGSICSVDANGVITGQTPGSVYLTAVLKQNGKTVRQAQAQVNVVRKVTKVTLLTNGLTVYEPDDPTIEPLLDPLPEGEERTASTLVVAAGKSVYLKFAFTPDDVREKNLIYETSDAGIAKINNNGMVTAVQRGECDLVISSKQSPEVQEKVHVLVTQPVKSVQINVPAKSLAAGKTMQLTATVTPDNATIQAVQWSSRTPKVAEVDANGVVTGISRGNTIIEARSTDGTNRVASFNLTVTQDVTELSIREADVTVATNRRSAQLHVDVQPKNANNQRLVWSSSDESIATVQNGYVSGRKAGECVVTCTSESNPECSASIPVHVIQMVTDIQYLTPAGLSFHIGESRQLDWQVFPEDASIKDVTFKSRAPKVASVDANGVVTGLAKGQADIEARATDGSGKYRVYRVTILKAVEGINALAPQYFAQLHRGTSIKATVYPSDASNQRILWSSSDESIATIRSSGVSYGQIVGRQRGWVTITATTEDGGFTTSTNVAVDDFDTLITCNSARIDENNKLRLVLWNMSRDYTVSRVYFRVDCYDTQGNPMICNVDGQSTFFNGNYPLTLHPGEHTEHGQFNFTDYMENGYIGYAVITVTGYEMDNGQKWWIPEEIQPDYRYRSEYSSHYGEPTPEPPIPPNAEESNG